MFNTIFYQPILQALLWFNSLTHNLGLSIILLTLVIRGVLIPLTIPSIKAAAKMRDLKPEIDKLKKKYKDKTKLQQAQMELFQKHQVNPASGCLPQIVQFIFLIALYRVFIDFLNNGSANIQGITFLWLNLNEPDPTYVLPIITGISQLILGFMILPATDTSAEKAIAATTPDKKDDAKAQDMAEMASTMQQQMVYVMPFMTAILATRFPSGLALYWVISTVFSAVQQYLISGPGGLAYYTNRLTSRLLPSKR